MKPLRIILFLAGISFLSLSACLRPCKDVTCENGGTCDSGICNCINGFEGDDCTVLARDKFLGSFNVNESCESGSNSYVITITSGSASDNVVIDNLYDFGEPLTATVTGNTLTIAPQSMGSAVVSGTITHGDPTSSLFFDLTVGNFTDNCSATARSI